MRYFTIMYTNKQGSRDNEYIDCKTLKIAINKALKLHKEGNTKIFIDLINDKYDEYDYWYVSSNGEVVHT